jgi:hypothetical protein
MAHSREFQKGSTVVPSGEMDLGRGTGIAPSHWNRVPRSLSPDLASG